MYNLSKAFLLVLLLWAASACSLIVPAAGGGGSDGDSDTDTDSDSDTDTDTDTDCESGAYQQCGDDGNVHLFDSCDVDEGLIQECGENAECVNTSDTEAECQCTGTYTNPPECNDCAPGWSGDGCNTLLTHVDVDSTASSPTGVDWDSAFQSIIGGTTEACNQLGSNPDAEGAQVWVADGMYYVFDTSNSNSITMCEGLQIYGGFEGFETQLSQRDPDQFTSVLSGWNSSHTDRVYHVVDGADDGVLDGLVIMGGSASLVGQASGGGLILTSGDMTISNCVFHGNEADWGGAIYLAGSSASIADSSFYDNDADQGGAVFLDFASASANVVGSVFASNTSSDDGGAIYTYEGNLNVEGSLFVGNTTSFGGALGFTNSTGTVETSLIVGNRATSVGGGALLESGADVDFINNTIWRNTAASTGGGVYSTTSTLAVGNCLVWDNMATSTWDTQDVSAPTGTALVSYCGLSSGTWGGSNGNHTPSSTPAFDPLFASTGAGWGADIDSVLFDAMSGITTIEFDGPPMPEGSLKGSYFDPDITDSSYRLFLVVGNSGNDIYLLGNATTEASINDWFGFFDAAISPLSPAIDMASDSLGTTTVDYYGEPRNDSYGRGNAGTITDMGAVETTSCVRVVSGGVGSSSPDGLDWNSALEDIQDGIDEAYSITQSSGGPDRCEVWVGSGDYFIHPGTPGGDDETIVLRDGVDLFGGFTAFGSTSRESADPMGNPTIVWGQDAIFPTYHSYHAITATDLSDAIVDGFIIVGGRAQNDPSSTFTDRYGGGLDIESSTLRVSRCKFHDNQGDSAGAIFGYDAILTLEDCHFSNNMAVSLYGGAIYLNASSTINTNRCSFQTNYSVNVGGALSTDGGGTLSSTVFLNNSSDTGNGAYDIFNGDTDVVNSTFIGNWSAFDGAGVGVQSSGLVRLINTTFHSNTATGNGGAVFNDSNSLAITNSVMWGDSPDETFNDTSATMDLSFSDVQGEASAPDNVISAAPNFELAYSSSSMGGGVSSFWFSNWYFYSSVQAPAGTSWSPGEMAGKYVVFDTSDGDIWYYVLDNSMDTLIVPGDIEANGSVATNNLFEIWSLRPGSISSPLIDTGTDTNAPEFDLDGVPRMDVPSIGDPGTVTDIGAYEFF